jgi:hypothetical protein
MTNNLLILRRVFHEQMKEETCEIRTSVGKIWNMFSLLII